MADGKFEDQIDRVVNAGSIVESAMDVNGLLRGSMLMIELRQEHLLEKWM